MRWPLAIVLPLAQRPPEPESNLRTMRTPASSPAYPGTRTAAALLLALLAGLAPLAARAQISLSTAVDLAEKTSPSVRAALAQVQKAAAALDETKGAYIPSFVAGASPGYAYGYPLGEPAFFSATSQSLIVSFSQPDYIRAARAGLNSARLSLRNTQQQTALDVALDYVQLDHDLREIAALDDERSYAETLVQIEQERVTAGVDPRITELQAELTAAEIDEKSIHLQNDADQMRQKLAHLTGLPAPGFATVTSSIPPVPALDALDDDRAAQNNPGVAASYANAKAKFYTAFGDARQNYRPLVSFGAQYALFQKFAGYTEYFRGFQYNNLALGVQVTFPIFDASRRARARESASDALEAEANADAARNVLSEQTLLTRGTVRELGAQQRVAQIQSELAQEQLKTVESEFTHGSGLPNAPAITPREAQQAHIEERERYEDLLDANFSLLKVELNLIRQTGQLDAWLQSALNAPAVPHAP